MKRSGSLTWTNAVYSPRETNTVNTPCLFASTIRVAAAFTVAVGCGEARIVVFFPDLTPHAKPRHSIRASFTVFF
ncbi:unnamed protein product [Linum trigynum]|uniref:Uncharacterized protein n=1 Tax=Linum trigynum TaxID=586398 RepID=A0AAV2GRF3_9ROSI